MKALNNLAALSLSVILGLVPFALIAVDEAAVAKTQATDVEGTNPVHALGMEGR